MLNPIAYIEVVLATRRATRASGPDRPLPNRRRPAARS